MRGEIKHRRDDALPAKFVQGVQALYELQTLMVPVVNGSSRQDWRRADTRAGALAAGGPGCRYCCDEYRGRHGGPR